MFTASFGLISNSSCTDEFGCSDLCPDFVLKRHDTKPDFKVSVEDCDGAIDFSDETIIVEASIWFNAKLKTAITETDDFFGFADNVGFQQCMVNDIIIMDQVRLPEQMLIKAFDEVNKLILVERGYNGTEAREWKKGSKFRVFRQQNAEASIEIIKEDLVQEDGSVLTDQIVETNLTYEWSAVDSCTPGCFYLEFRVIKMEASMLDFTDEDFSPSDFGCELGEGVEWSRKFGDFLIKINDIT